jgi:hypothetical protein
MTNGGPERHDTISAFSPFRVPDQSTQSSSYEVILDKQTHLLITTVNQQQDIRITAEDKTGERVGVLEAKTKDVCNGANPLLGRVECPDGQPGIGYVLLVELHQFAERKGGIVSYSEVDDPTRQWLTNNGLSRLLRIPASPNI